MTVTVSRPPAAVVPAPLPTPPDKAPTPGTAAHPFAELLRQNRVADRAAGETPRPATTSDGAKPESNGNDVADSSEAAATTDASPKSEAGRARARSGASRSTARPAVAVERPGRGSDDDAAHESQDDVTKAAPGDAFAAAGVAAAARADAARLADAEARGKHAIAEERGAFDASADANASDAGQDIGRGGKPRRAGTDPAAATDTGRSTARATSPDAEASATSFAQALAESKAQDRPAAVAATADPSAPGANLAVAPHEALQQAAPGSDAPVPSSTLPVPIDSPEFASALGVQVSVFVRDGVQHAELHLNPVETGPVSIAITLDGSQARVEFGADLAATRAAIENGLPELASALRDAGFTLAGGGVAQHARSGGGQGGGDDPAGRGGRGRGEARGHDAIEAAVQRTTRRVAAGGVDLYA